MRGVIERLGSVTLHSCPCGRGVASVFWLLELLEAVFANISVVSWGIRVLKGKFVVFWVCFFVLCCCGNVALALFFLGVCVVVGVCFLVQK